MNVCKHLKFPPSIVMSHRLLSDTLDAFVPVRWLTSVGFMGLRAGEEGTSSLYSGQLFFSNFSIFVKGFLDLSLCPRFHPLLSTSPSPCLSCGFNYFGGVRPAPMLDIVVVQEGLWTLPTFLSVGRREEPGCLGVGSGWILPSQSQSRLLNSRSYTAFLFEPETGLSWGHQVFLR